MSPEYAAYVGDLAESLVLEGGLAAALQDSHDDGTDDEGETT